MQIFIRPVVNEDGIKELAIIELQGDLESKGQDELAGKLVGDLHYTKNGIPILIIGHHILYGKVQKLTKPFGVLEKVMTIDEKTEYQVKALIKRKLSFRERPKPIVSNVRKRV